MPEITTFRKPYNEYRRDFDYRKLYIMQCLTYGKIDNPDIDLDDYKNFIEQSIAEGGRHALFNPRMRMVIKDENNDRQLCETTMMDYLRTIVRRNLRFAPTFTTYVGEDVKLSLESEYLTVGQETRNEEKRKKFAAQEAGDTLMAEYHDNMQVMCKILNNSSSGAKAVEGSILFNSTGHSTLTSVCRSITSFANSTNERFLGGYRHYFDAQSVINNVLAILTFCDEEETRQVMEKYKLHYVTADELVQMVKRSTDLYWRNEQLFAVVEDFLRKLTPIQRSMYIYNSDLYSLRVFNSDFVRHWFKSLITTDHLEPITDEELSKHYISYLDADLSVVVAMYCTDLCDGKSVKTAMRERPEIIPKIAAVVKNCVEVFDYYADLIKCFWVTDVMPFETARVPDMMRGVVLGSDTDSSLFSLDYFWVQWYNGEIIHDKTADDVNATVVYLTSQHIVHVLGQMTGVCGVNDKKKGIIAMKNEFMFSSFTTTSAGKHYFAKKDAQEGILIPTHLMKTEIKGVMLQHSKVAKHITNRFKETLNRIMRMIQADEKMKLIEFVREIALLEKEVYDSICRAEPIYLKRGQVKTEYKKERAPALLGHYLWKEVFAETYGQTAEPPYDTLAINVSTNTYKKFITFVESIEDIGLRERFLKFIKDYEINSPIQTYYLPQAVVSTTGIPDILKRIMLTRQIVHSVTAPWYLILESLGVFMINKSLTRLCSDMFEDTVIPMTMDDETDIMEEG